MLLRTCNLHMDAYTCSSLHCPCLPCMLTWVHNAAVVSLQGSVPFQDGPHCIHPDLSPPICHLAHIYTILWQQCMDVGICRQLGTLFQKADQLAEDARKASSNASFAQKEANKHMLQASREFEQKRDELEAEITAQRAELSAGRSQLVSHCCC